MSHIVPDADIVYENGAVVRTAFVTSFGGDVVARSCPELHDMMAEASEKLRKQKTRELPKYSYPAHVLTAAMLQRFSKYGVHFEVRRSDCVRVSELDAQKEHGKSIFGSGLLMSDSKAAEKAAAEKAAAEKVAAEKAAAEKVECEVWELSERERAIVAALGR